MKVKYEVWVEFRKRGLGSYKLQQYGKTGGILMNVGNDFNVFAER